MGSPGVFFDTTILIYFVTDADRRAPIADELLSAGGHISVQVLNEFVSVARRKLKLPWEEVSMYLGAIRALCEAPAPLTLEVHEAAVKIAERYRYHIYDSLMIASALKARCAVLYSEDMQNGQRIDSLTLRNPFVR